MEILHIVTRMDPKTGGVCQAINTIINGLSVLGIHNEVASVDAPNEPYISGYSFPIHALGPSKSSWQYSARLVPWLVNNITRFNVIIVHGLWLHHSYAVQSVIQQLKRDHYFKKKIPQIFIMPHGMLDPWFQKSKERKLKAIRNWLYWKLIEGEVVHSADGILFTCQEELLQARNSFRPYKPIREINVGYGIARSPSYIPSMKAAFLKKCSELTTQPYLLFLGRIHMKKGVDLLIKAYALVKEKSQSVGLKMPNLVIAGPGLETAYGHSIQQLVAKNPILENSVFFPGMLTGNAKWGAFYGCSAFILPSHQENFGIAIVEALSCGKPVLISNQVNIWREIESVGGGFVAPNSMDGTLQLLETWVTLPANEKLNMEQKARYTFEKHFNVASTATRMIEAIRV